MFSLLLHCQSWLMINLNSKSPKFSTPRLITDVMPASYCTLSNGCFMKTLMKRPLVYLQLNLDMLQSLSQITTWHTLENWVPCCSFDFPLFSITVRNPEILHMPRISGWDP